MAAPRYRAGRLLDRPGRRFEPGALLPAEMGLARRPREEVEHLPGRSGMASPARRNRGERPDRPACRELLSATHQLLVGEVINSPQRHRDHREIKKTGVPAKAGTHPSAVRASDKWIPAF